MSIFECFDASYGAGLYESMPDGIGGANIMHDGLTVDHAGADGVLDSLGMTLAVPNVEGGTDIFEDGELISHSMPNVFGGTDTYHGTKLVSSTISNVMDGVDIFDEAMDMQGFTTPNVFGGEDLISFGNAAEMMSFDDPLAHSADFCMEPLEF